MNINSTASITNNAIKHSKQQQHKQTRTSTTSATADLQQL
jgi:hypothetical protein